MDAVVLRLAEDDGELRVAPLTLAQLRLLETQVCVASSSFTLKCDFKTLGSSWLTKNARPSV